MTTLLANPLLRTAHCEPGPRGVCLTAGAGLRAGRPLGTQAVHEPRAPLSEGPVLRLTDRCCRYLETVRFTLELAFRIESLRGQRSTCVRGDAPGACTSQVGSGCRREGSACTGPLARPPSGQSGAPRGPRGAAGQGLGADWWWWQPKQQLLW